MRTFLAVSPPRETARDIYSAYTPFRDAWKGVRWVTPERYHITLAFLGELQPAIVKDAVQAFATVLGSFPVFDVSPKEPGFFGNPRSPKLFYLNIGRGAAELAAIHTALSPVLHSLSLKVDNTYRPHLTLGRSGRRGPSGPADGSLLPPGMKTDNVGFFRAKQVVLYQSVLKPDGPDYSVHTSWPLKEAS